MRRLLVWAIILLWLLPSHLVAQEGERAAISPGELDQGQTIPLAGVAIEAVPEGELAPYAQQLVLALLDGQAGEIFALLTPDLKQVLSIEDLQAVPEQILPVTGAFIGWGAVQTMDNTVVLSMQMENIDLAAVVSFTEEGRLENLSITLDSGSPAESLPLAANEEAVEIGPYALPGVLTMPQGEGVPAVVLVHGSGPNDRNETAGDTAIFRDLAEGLSQRGIAVLRYDKRTYQMQQGYLEMDPQDILGLTVYDETIEDAVAAVKLLKADPRIDAGRVFVLGHSLGAMLANRIEAEGADAKGLILLAGTVRPLAYVLADQLEAINPEAYQEDIELARGIRERTAEQLEGLFLLGSPAYYFWEEAQHDLEAVAATNQAPMLILHGADDVQIYRDPDFALWEAFAQQHPQREITLKLYQGLGHAFVEESVLSEEVLEDIAQWIAALEE